MRQMFTEFRSSNVTTDKGKKALKEVSRGTSHGRLTIDLINDAGNLILGKPFQIHPECLQSLRIPKVEKKMLPLFHFTKKRLH